MTAFQVLPPNRYRTDEFLVLLGQSLKKEMSDRTLRDWCKFFGISRDDQGFFWKEDLDLLRAWIRYRRKHGRKRNRLQFLAEYDAKQKAKQHTQTTIDVHTQEII